MNFSQCPAEVSLSWHPVSGNVYKQMWSMSCYFYFYESCPLTKLNGGLSRLHSAMKMLFCGSPVMVH